MADRGRDPRERRPRVHPDGDGDDDASGRDKARRLLEEAGGMFKQGGAALLEGARAQGIGFLYDGDEGQVKERDKAPAERVSQWGRSNICGASLDSAAGAWCPQCD